MGEALTVSGFAEELGDGEGVGVGDGEGVGVGEGIGVGDGVDVSVGDGVTLGRAVGAVVAVPPEPLHAANVVIAQTPNASAADAKGRGRIQ